jgi:hypothetical protein
MLDDGWVWVVMDGDDGWMGVGDDGWMGVSIYGVGGYGWVWMVIVV